MITMSLLLSTALALASSTAEEAPPKALYLLYRGDAKSVELYYAARKEHEFRPLPRRNTAHRVRLLDAGGVELAQVSVDLAGYCLDPSHVGHPPHLRGDVVQPHELLIFAALPDLPKMARVVFEARDSKPGTDALWREQGTANVAALRRLIEIGRTR